MVGPELFVITEFYCIYYSYAENDPKWLRVQRLREEGIKELAVAGPINFLPWIRFLMPKLKQTMNWIIEVRGHSNNT
jgi:hypothetical protein